MKVTTCWVPCHAKQITLPGHLDPPSEFTVPYIHGSAILAKAVLCAQRLHYILVHNGNTSEDRTLLSFQVDALSQIRQELQNNSPLPADCVSAIGTIMTTYV